MTTRTWQTAGSFDGKGSGLPRTLNHLRENYPGVTLHVVCASAKGGRCLVCGCAGDGVILGETGVIAPQALAYVLRENVAGSRSVVVPEMVLSAGTCGHRCSGNKSMGCVRTAPILVQRWGATGFLTRIALIALQRFTGVLPL